MGYLLPHQALPCPEGQQRRQLVNAMPVWQHASPLMKIQLSYGGLLHVCCITAMLT